MRSNDDKAPAWKVRLGLIATLVGGLGVPIGAALLSKTPHQQNISVSAEEMENVLELNKPPILSRDSAKSKRMLEDYIKKLSPVVEKNLSPDKLLKRNDAVSEVAEKAYEIFITALVDGKDLKTACRAAAKTSIIGYLEDHKGPHNICPHSHAPNNGRAGQGR